MRGATLNNFTNEYLLGGHRPSTSVNRHNVNSMLLAYLTLIFENVKGKLCVFCNKHINLTIQLIQRNKDKYDLP